MKRNTFLSKFFASLTLCTMFASCADQDAVINDITPDTPAEVQPFTISATIGDAVQTRTTLNEQSGQYSMVWAAGDQISVVYPGSGFDVAHRFTLSAGEGTKSGTFTDSGQIHNGMLGQGTDGACATNAPYYIGYYPDATFGTWRDDKFNAWLHATQTYDPNGPDNYPMYAFTTDLSDMKFEGINSVLQLNVSSSVGDYKVKYIKVAGAGITGSAGVVVKTDAEGKPYGELAIGGSAHNITLVCNDEPISATAKPFYIHIIPGHQSNLTIKLILENAGGTQCVSTFSANNLDFAARGLYPIDLNISKTPAADKSAEPIRGVDLNDKIKKQVNSSAHSGMGDNTIKTINFIPNSSKQGTVISTSESAYAVYASLEGDVVNVTTLAEKFTLGADCKKVFYRLAKLEQINGLEYVDTQAVTDFSSMFDGCSALKSLDLSTWDTSSATTMEGMFSNCSALTSLDLRNFNTSSVTDMSSMFYGCRNLTELNLSSFNTRSVVSFASMYVYLDHLATLDLRNFDMSSANDYSSMFYYSKGLTNVYLPAQFFPSSCYSWDGNWNTTDDPMSLVFGALFGIEVNSMLSGTAQDSTCTFHCQEEKDEKILNAIKDTNGSGCGTLNIEQCTHQP